MAKKLLTFFVVMNLVSVASAVVIDDFESYANTAALQAAWVDVSTNDQGQPGISTATPTLVTLDNGSKAMFLTAIIPGGWDYPDAAAPWEAGYDKAQWEATSERARIEFTLAVPINIAAQYGTNWQLKFDLKLVGHVEDLGDLNVFGVDESGSFGRTLIPCGADITQNGLQWWYPADWVPDLLGPMPDLTGTPYEGLSIINVGAWGQIICDDTRELNWNWGNAEMSSLTALVKIALEINSDTNLGEGFLREVEAGEKYPIQGGVYGFYIDNVELVPEPATIALLGFGGLALLRVRRKG
jgi:hypothetical protein